jgi:hypothetical protein
MLMGINSPEGVSEILFILGLPRSGTTLLQDVLCHAVRGPRVPESWFFVNYYGSRNFYALSEFGSAPTRKGLNYFMSGQPKAAGLSASLEEGRLLTALYAYYVARGHRLLSTPQLLVEKTPRNLLVYNHLRAAYTEKNFICLLRCPLDIALSIATTWGGRIGIFRAYLHNVDLKVGASAMLQAISDGAQVLKYEDFVRDPSIAITHPLVSRHFLSRETPQVAVLSSELGGDVMGDPLYGKKYSQLSTASSGVFAEKVSTMTAVEIYFLKRLITTSPPLQEIMKRYYAEDLQFLLSSKGTRGIRNFFHATCYLAVVVAARLQLKALWLILRNQRLFFIR